MSFRMVADAMDFSRSTLAARLVLFVLAEHAHDDGAESYPSVETIARRTRLSRRGVQAALRKLEAIGEVVADGKGPQGQTKWRIVLDRSGGADSAQGADHDAGGAQNTTGGGEARSPEPSLEPPFEPSSEIARTDAIPKSMSFRRRKVPPRTIEVAARAVRYFAKKTGQTLAIVDGTGAPSESMRRVAGAMLAHPELADPAFAQRTIDFALAAPWWKDEGPPGVGVVFGPRVVERMIGQARADAPPPPRPASARESASDLLRDLGS